MNEKAGTSARLQVAPSDVVTLTADNFDEIVADVTKDVLVEFYAPCMRLNRSVIAASHTYHPRVRPLQVACPHLRQSRS